jgi:broad specificity phosphatase PhoE
MPRLLHLISHPNVIIDPAVPVPRWHLSEIGKARMAAGLEQPWIPQISSIYSSTEQKAIDTATILAAHLAIGFKLEEDLGENDRSSTGFLKPDEFEAVADEFFANPEISVRGWERAIVAQHRIVNAVARISQQDRSRGDIAIVSHGAVGTLLYCFLSGHSISRKWDQPPNGGGNFFTFTMNPPEPISWWAAVDRGAA